MTYVRQPGISARELASRLSDEFERPISAANARVMLHRARQRFAELLVQEVEYSLENPTSDELAAELKTLRLWSLCEPVLLPPSTAGQQLVPREDCIAAGKLVDAVTPIVEGVGGPVVPRKCRLASVVPEHLADETLDGDGCGDPLPLPRPLTPAVNRVASAVFARTADEWPGKSPPAVAGHEILRELGRGGMGVVYEARQLALDRTVALKMVLLGAHAGPTQLARFRNEALATARLQHPNIVQIHAVGQHDGMPFLALELIDGPSLSEKLRQNTLPAATSAALTEQLARALHYAHGQGIVHRDLKPANVMLAPCDANAAGAIGLSGGDGVQHFVPKITDFGLAKSLAHPDEMRPLQSTATGELLGTPHYMAPEQVMGHRDEVRPTADVYCLGAILYEMLTGRPPFQGTSLFDMLDQVRQHEPIAPRWLRRDIPRDLETICLKCLEKTRIAAMRTPGNWPTTCGVFSAAGPFSPGRPVPGTASGNGRRGNGRKVPGMVVIILAAVLLSVGGWWSSVRLSALADNLQDEVTRADRAAEVARQQRDQAQRREQEAARSRQETEQQRQIADQNFQQAATTGGSIHQPSGRRSSPAPTRAR